MPAATFVEYKTSIFEEDGMLYPEEKAEEENITAAVDSGSSFLIKEPHDHNVDMLNANIESQNLTTIDHNGYNLFNYLFIKKYYYY